MRSLWPMFMHDRKHTGRSPYKGAQKGKLKWKFRMEEGTVSSPVIGENGMVCVTSDEGCLYAVNPDGTLKWKFKTGTFVYSSPAIGEDGTIYIGASNFFYAVNPDGTIKWTFKSMETLGLKCNSCPAIGGDGTIYVTFEENFLAINPDGTKKWGCFQFWQKPGDVPDPSPVVDRDGTIYLGGNRLRAFDVKGFLKWEYDHESGNSHIYPVICGDGVLYAVAEKGKYIKSKGEYRSEYYLYALE